WDVSSGAEIVVLKTLTDEKTRLSFSPTGVAFSPDTLRLAVSYQDRISKLWDLPKRTLTLPPPTAPSFDKTMKKNKEKILGKWDVVDQAKRLSFEFLKDAGLRIHDKGRDGV